MNEHDTSLTGKNLLFIVGCPRSGTTWLQRLVAAHPQIQTGQESRLFEYIGTQFRFWRQDLASVVQIGRGGTGLACYLDEQEFLAIQKNYLASLLGPMLKDLPPGRIFLEKTPGHALFVPEIIKLLPAAKIIHLIRDPRDVVASHLAAANGWGSKWATRRIKIAVEIWRQHVIAAQTAGAQLPPGQFLELHYEDLFTDPAGHLRQIAGFARLTWSDVEIARAVELNTADVLKRGGGTPIPIRGEHGKASNCVVREPKGFVRKARPGAWREDFSPWQRWRLARALRKISPTLGRYQSS